MLASTRLWKKTKRRIRPSPPDWPVATGQSGSEGQILRFVFLHSLVLACLIGVLTMLQAYVFTWMIPAI